MTDNETIYNHARHRAVELLLRDEGWRATAYVVRGREVTPKSKRIDVFGGKSWQTIGGARRAVVRWLFGSKAVRP